jgi:hypothetical protein
MRRVFADSVYFFALLNKKDLDHVKAPRPAFWQTRFAVAASAAR